MIHCQMCGRPVVGYFDHVNIDCMDMGDDEVAQIMEEQTPGYAELLQNAKEADK